MGGWYYNEFSGVLNRVPTAFEFAYDVPFTGWKKLAIPYTDTREQAIADAKKQFPNSASPGGPILGNATHDVFKGSTSVGEFLARLESKAIWTRVGEVLLGGILVYAGVRALTQGSGTVGVGARKTATKPVRKVASAVTTVAAPEVRYAARTAGKRVAPKTAGRVSAHREAVRKYGAKTPYTAPAPRQPTVRISHIHHHRAPKPPAKPKVTP